eukprot:XP_001690531.1 predicted protein [Chlamydomonas reinhardtii]
MTLRPPPQAAERSQRLQRHQLVCALPQPSTTLQELLVQQSAKQRLVQPAGPASSTEAPAAQGAVGSYRALLDAALRSADPDVTAALLATASAAAAQQQEWRSQLPALDRLLCSWPLAELQEQLQCQPPGAVGRSGQAPRLARSPMVTALEADACESRGDLWALFCHVMEAHQAEQAAASEAAAAAAAAGGETGLQQHQHQMGAGEEEEQGAEDDPDVYITDDALVCLAALGSEVHGRCGWSLPVMLGLVLGSWTRMCTRAMAAGAAGGAAGPGDAVCGHAADGGQGQGCAGDEAVDGLHEVPTAAHSDSCECCQQDEWRLGPGASLLVLSHCDVAAAASGTCSRAGAQAPAGWQADGRPGGMAVAAEVEPVQVMALAARGSAYAAQAAGCNGVDSGASGTSAAAAALAAAAAHYPELACRAQLLRGCVETQVVVVDPADGAVLAQQRLGPGALARLSSQDQVERCWRLAAQLLGWLQRLPPGPYELRLDLSLKRLELRGVHP